MKAVVQRVQNASVFVEGTITGHIHRGLLVYLGVALEDTVNDADWMADKIINLRIFDDPEGKMNLSLIDVVNQYNFNGNKSNITMVNRDNNEVNIGILAISQFTLLGDARKGRRPSWSAAAPPEKAEKLYLYFTKAIREKDIMCQCGVFQARMQVSYTNEGPVTILLDSRE